jgi:hypothetical protein
MRIRQRPPKQFVEPLGVYLAAKKIRFGKNAAEEACIGFDTGGGVFLESAAEAGDGFFAAIAPSD